MPNSLSIEVHVYHHYDLGQQAPAWVGDLFHKMERLKELMMNVQSEVADLKAAMTDLITEATTDITSLITQINSQSGSNPEVVALTTQVRQAIVDLHKGFTDATGVKLPAPPAA